MDRRRADIAVGVLLGGVILIGGALGWQAYRQRVALDGSMGGMMDTSMTAMHGPDPLWPVAGALLVAVVVGVPYLLIRTDLPTGDDGRPDRTAGSGSTAGGGSTAGDGTESPNEETDSPNEEATSTASTDAETAEPSSESAISNPSNPEANPQARVLDLLPDDERRVLEPVLDSPGVTQIELRDRSDFSKSKVSQTVSALEERGLLYREKQGRTYRVYPSEDLRRNSGDV